MMILIRSESLVSLDSPAYGVSCKDYKAAKHLLVIEVRLKKEYIKDELDDWLKVGKHSKSCRLLILVREDFGDL